MEILFVSLLPVVIILYYVWSKDKYEREPTSLLARAFFFGVLSTMLASFFAQLLYGNMPVYGDYRLQSFLTSFLAAALPEETAKFIMLFLLIWRNRNFNEHYDGIVYGVFVASGFAALENILYVVQHGLSVGIMRAFLAVPAHALFGVVMGFYLSLAKFHDKMKPLYFLKSLGYPIIAHTIYNYLLFASDAVSETNPYLAVFTTVVFYVFVFYLWKLGLYKIRVYSNFLEENSL